MKYKKTSHRICCILAVMVMIMVLNVPSSVMAAETSGTCGSGLTWTLADGVLTITGSGHMEDYKEPEQIPWYEYRAQITSIIVEDGVTSIGNVAFYGCENVFSVTLPETVEDIGGWAFAGCSSLYVIQLNEGLQSIGESAFECCEALTGMTLPQTLRSIGDRAFYRCYGLLSITIPSSVTYMGVSVFAYCRGLRMATIEAQLTEVPAWTFYGCDALVGVSLPATVTSVGEYAFFDCENLDTAYYQGAFENKDQIQTDIQNGLPDFDNVQAQPAYGAGDSYQNVQAESDQNTDTLVRTEISQGEGSVVSVVTTVVQSAQTENPVTESESIQIEAIVSQTSGWTELMDQLDAAVRRVENPDITVSVLLTGDVITGETINRLAGRNIVITIRTTQGAVWTLNGKDLTQVDSTKEYALTYHLTGNTSPTAQQKELFGDAVNYRLIFDATIDFAVTVSIPVEAAYAREYASLWVSSGSGLERVQMVVMDNGGAAEFHLGNTDAETEYLIAIGDLGIETVQEEAIIPSALYDEYGGLTDASGTKYVITGSKSSWGISFGQVNLILVAVMAGMILIVGVVIGVMNRRKTLQVRLERERELAALQDQLEV